METGASGQLNIAIVSDIHFAGVAERLRGNDYECRAVANPLMRASLRFYRHFFWMRNPLDNAPQLDRFLDDVGPVDYVIANGDYSCDTAFVGLSDPAAFASAEECIGKLRGKFGDKTLFTLGDHELGKHTLAGGNGGMRLASWYNTTQKLVLKPFWTLSLGNYVLMGVASPLIALPANQTETLPEEWPEWLKLREDHLMQIRTAFDVLKPEQRVILFCHDPTALPFLWREEKVKYRLSQVEHTIIGHLHTRLILWKSRLLSGIPPVKFLGNSVRKLTSALHEAHHWWAFRVRLCPALSGTELLNDGGYYVMQLDLSGRQPVRFVFHPLPC